MLPFIITNPSGSSDPFIAPLWINDHENGFIFYRSTQNVEILYRVQELIMNASSRYRDYQPTLAVIATWISLSPIPRHPAVDLVRTLSTNMCIG